MTNTTVRILVLLSLGLAFFVGEQTAAASCKSPNAKLWNTADMPIEVLINESLWTNPPGCTEEACMTSLCDAPGSTCGGASDFRWTIEHALNEFYSSTNGKLRFHYAGTTTATPGSIIPGYVHISSYPSSDACMGVGGVPSHLARADAQGSGTYATSGRVRFCRYNLGGTIDWGTYSFVSGGPISFHKVLLHELGHVIGMDHIEDCASPLNNYMSMMKQSYGDTPATQLFDVDIEYVNSHYGFRNNIGRSMWTASGTSWSSGATGGVGESSAQGRFFATSTARGDDIFVGHTERGGFPLWISNYKPGAWTARSYLFAFTPYHAALSSSWLYDVILSWGATYDAATGNQQMGARASNDGGYYWPSYVQLSDSPTETSRAGISATYDSASDDHVMLWRGSSGQADQIIYRVMVGGAFPFLLEDPITGNPITAADTPSIACGDVWVVGSENCLVAWVDATSWMRVVRWAQGHVSGGKLILSQIKTHNYIGIGSPSVTYWDDGPYPWMIALIQGGYTTFTWRKGPFDSSAFQDGRSFVFSPKVTPPAMGARYSSGPTGGRAYVFTMDQ